MAVVAGLIAGLARAGITGRRLNFPDLSLIWLAPVAYLPQFLAFQLPATRRVIPDRWAAAALVGSQLMLLGFAWANRRRPGFWLLGLGLASNLAIIAVHGGWMPIRPEIVASLVPGAPPETWQAGERFGTSKDVILPGEEIRLEWLSDRFVTPGWFPYRYAFSLGDILIALGAFLFCWSLGGRPRRAGAPGINGKGA